MHKQIYVNLPVADLDRAKAFFSQLGFTFNPQFTDEKAACMVIGENIYAMLLTRAFFQGFTGKAVADAHTTTEVLLCISCTSRAEVDDLVARAVAAGGTAPRAAKEFPPMYFHGFEDLDGHVWELMHAPDP